MNVPMFETEHLILRRFIERDLHALYLIYSDKEANRFLPWFPAANIDDARSIFDSRYADPAAFAYAVCLKADAYPIGYVNVGNEEPRMTLAMDCGRNSGGFSEKPESGGGCCVDFRV